MATLPSISAADTYHTARATAAWLALDNDVAKTAALLRAQDYILAMYALTAGIEDDNAILVKATIMLAGEMTAPQRVTDTSALVKKSTKSMDGVGSIEVEYENKQGDPYPLVTATLKPILTSTSGASIRTIRMVL